MKKDIKKQIEELNDLKLPALQARYAEIVGEETRARVGHPIAGAGVEEEARAQHQASYDDEGPLRHHASDPLEQRALHHHHRQAERREEGTGVAH